MNALEILANENLYWTAVGIVCVLVVVITFAVEYFKGE